MKFVAILIVLFGTAASLSATQTTTTTSLTSSLNPSIYGQAVTFTAMVSSTAGAPPDGESVTFTQGKNVLGTSPLKHGTATYKISTLAAGGVDTIKAMYSGDSNFAVSTSVAVSQVVNKASTTTTLTTGQNPSNYGQSVTLTATVTGEFGGTPTGNVLFYNGSTKLATVALSGAVANYTTATLAAGTDSLTAVYNGSTSFTGSTSSPVSQVVNQATTSTTMISSLNPSKAGQSVTFTATIAPQFGGTVTGTVTFYNGSAILKTATVSGGAAKLTTATLPTGTDTIMATYSGNADFTGSSASVNQVVNAKSVGVHIDSTMTWDAVTRYYDIYL